MTRCNAKYKAEILLRCYDALERQGFKRYRKDGVDWPFNEDFHGWIGLNTGLYEDHLEINPFVGVHVPPIMRFYTELEGRKYSRSTATFALHIGELQQACNKPAFIFRPDCNGDTLKRETDRLAKLCTGVGMEYARSISSFDNLLPLLINRVDMLGGYPERVASCLYLMGRRKESCEFSRDFLEREPGYFGAFANVFLDKFCSSKS